DVELLEGDESASAPAPVLTRVGLPPAAAQAAESAPKKKKKSGRKKKRKKSESGDGLDKRVIGAVGAVGAVCLVAVAFFVWDSFLKPPTIVGTWKGSRTEYEIGRSLSNTKYELLLDDQNRA